MKIALIYNHLSPSTTGAYIEKVLKNKGVAYDLFGVIDPALVKPGYDLYLRIDHGDYKFDLPKELHPAVFWAIDTHLKKPYKKIRSQAGHYDVVFCAQKDGAARLQRELKIDAQWLPLGCDPDVHKKLDLPKIYDLAFVGRNAQKFARGRQLELLKKRYPASFIGQADFARMSGIYSAARIGFNSSIINDINMRVFEVMSCGCFLLTNRIKNNGFPEIFVEGRHLVTYGNDREMLKAIDYYLEHDEERERIAREGHKLVREKFTYYHGLQKMFNYLAYKFGGGFNSLRI
jgi:hypothetical protein